MTPDEFDALPMRRKKAMRAELSELGKAACEYAEMGWSVFPLRPMGKEPDLPSGFKEATDDWESCCWFWSEYPDRNVGIATGMSGLLVVDVDADRSKGKYGDESLFEWEQANGKLPETACATTGSGGTHYLFRTSSSMSGTSNQVLNIDVKADGGYVVAPPSVHPNGNRYEWDLDPWDTDVAFVDDRVLELVAYVMGGSGGAGGEPGDGRYDFPEVVHDGEGREQHLLTLGYSLRAQGLDHDSIRRELSRVNAERVVPPKPERDIRRIAKSVCKKPAGLSPEYQAAKDRAERRKAEDAERAAIEYEQSVSSAIESGAEPEPEPIDPSAFRMGRNGLDHALVGTDMIERFHAKKIDGVPAVWIGGRYETGWEPIRALVHRYKFNAKESERNEVVRWLDLKMPSERKGDWRNIGFTNGTLNVETGELSGSDPSMNVTNVIPHRWNPDARCDVVESTLMDIACGDPMVYVNLCEVIGVCMCRAAFFGKVFLLINNSGANGKSTFINFLRGILGEDNCSSVDMQVMGERFQSTPMMGKLANIADDIPSDMAKSQSLATLKRAVTGDWVPYEVKGGVSSSFRSYCTQVFSMNRVPPLGDSTGGMERRLHPIPFNAKFDGATADMHRGERLEEEDAYEYAIRLGIEALMLAKECGITETDYSKAMTSEIEMANNQVKLFIAEEEWTSDSLSMKPTSELYSAYRDWADESGIRNTFSRKRFTQAVCDEMGMAARKTTGGDDGRNVYRYVS